MLHVSCCTFVLLLKKEHKPKLLGLDIFRWGAGLPPEGVGAKKFGVSLGAKGEQTFWLDIPRFCQDIPEALVAPSTG